MPRLLIDATPIDKNNKGVGRYAYQLCLQMSDRLPEDWEMAVLIYQGCAVPFPSGFRGQFIEIPLCSELVHGYYWTPRYCQQWQADALLRTHEFAGYQTGIYNVTVCHDISELIVKAQKLHRSPFRIVLDAGKQLLRNHMMRSSDLVVCNSEFTRLAVMERYGVAKAKTALGYCGVDERFYTKAPDVDKRRVLEKYAVDGFVLTFATGDPRENYQILPQIMRNLQKSGETYTLLIAGANSQRASTIALVKEFTSLGLQQGKHYIMETFLGEERFSDLVDLYTTADFYLELSLHEGFGMQLAEAMACGTTCLSTGYVSLAEVRGPFSISLDNQNTQEIADTIVDCYRKGLHGRSNDEQVAFSRRYNWDMAGKVVCNSLATAFPQA